MAAAFIAAVPVAQAEMLEVIGTVYPIQEPDLMEAMQNRMAKMQESGEMDKLRKEYQEKMKGLVNEPPVAKQLSRTNEPRTFYYDPTLIVPYNVLDHKGDVLVPAGTRLNPLDTVSLNGALVFFNSADEQQMNYVRQYIKGAKQGSRLILVAGRTFDTMKALDHRVFFDQGAALIKKFGIEQVPAIVVQDGRRLRIDEVVPE
ncbi:MAG: hypothetical protein AMS22_15475 [Thiotrichales bacterium SG8_50]|nr:MAG: hypothetical protein AMS22_15475 [Thiotrichales bacterium SG8_50]